MIGSFWNLCRACPSMPVDKLHSEYRSTYRWHEYTGPRQEIVRRPPQSSAAANADDKINDTQSYGGIQEEDTHNELPKLEPALPRRKKHPDLAYRHHEFLVSDGNAIGDKSDSNVDRARSEERSGSHWRPSRRSKSEGPARGNNLMNPDRERRRDSDPDLDNTDTGILRKAISKLSTEYRLQFAWPPQGRTSRRDISDSAPRKSQSMGALKPAANAIIHRKRTDFENKDASELEPLVNNKTIHEDDKKEEIRTEYKKNFRPFSQYDYAEGKFTNKKDVGNEDVPDTNQNIMDGNLNKESWYQEVVELRKKAGEYKHRGWGSELAPERLSEVYNKQVELWDQVSRRSSLSALSLASAAHRSYTKEEKEEANNKRASPTKPYKDGENSVRMMNDFIRHHLQRTTGGSGKLDGLILSPTREKLEPTIPRKDDDSRGSQKNSPKKGSPQKATMMKKSTQRSKSALRTVRSHSVGPPDTNVEKKSPKRQLRSATVREKKTTPTTARRPRPSSLNTSSASSRSKSSSVPPKKEDERLAKNKTQIDTSVPKSNASERKGGGAEPTVKTDQHESNEKPIAPQLETDHVDLEPVVKSPPEPTRVKSPEQILMRSPDPVNWTVPLDTGKTFTVTQNVREGDIGSRPHSEIKAWTPPEVPPPVAQSAPPELSQQAKDQAVTDNNTSVPSTPEDLMLGKSCKLEPLPEEATLYCLKDSSHTLNPSSKISTGEELGSPPPSSDRQSLFSGVMESARQRFDSFWANQKNGST